MKSNTFKIASLIIILLVTPVFLNAQLSQDNDSTECKDLEMGIQKRGGTQVPVYDESNLAVNTITAAAIEGLWIKECRLDPEVRRRAKEMLDDIIDKTIQYLNSSRTGLSPTGEPQDGQPYFVQNIGEHLEGVAAAEATEIIEKVGDSNAPFSSDTAALLKYDEEVTPSYNLNEVDGIDVNAFLAGDVTKGGFKAWLAYTQNPHNNPMGSYIVKKQEIQDAKKAAKSAEMAHLNWGEGTLPRRDADGKVTMPASVHRDMLTTTTNYGVTSLQNTDEVGEIGKTEGDFIKDVVEGEDLQEIRIDSNEGYEVGDLDFGNLTDTNIGIWQDLFSLDDILSTLGIDPNTSLEEIL